MRAKFPGTVALLVLSNLSLALFVFFQGAYFARAMPSTDANPLPHSELTQTTVVADPCKVKYDDSASSAIPGSFNVSDCLKVCDQQVVPGAPTNGESNPSGVPVILAKAIGLLVKLIGSLSLIVFIIGALLAISSEGKEDRLEKGKKAMLGAVIGLIITLFSFLLVSFVQTVLF